MILTGTVLALALYMAGWAIWCKREMEKLEDRIYRAEALADMAWDALRGIRNPWKEGEIIDV